MLINNDNDDIVTIFLILIKKWIRAWHFRYVVIDNFVAKQRAIRLIFFELIVDEQKVNHFLCKIHSKRILNRVVAKSIKKKIRNHLYNVLYYCKIKSKCEKSIETIKKIVFDEKIRNYIIKKW